ncbi:hypothetical protein [Borrelia sp. RT5S]|uniref:hypothetical protein n=1 Tax=Borrelia sp. RT5S TaxID=2898581 RepID=UPI001E3B659E|nr:hypothetical protein [Borrelia sp. RT5S]UGQ16773.1 hypothetical protein LSO06_05480 [Borrelia sp. RT5S]
MKMYRTLLMLLVVVMSCGLQTSTKDKTLGKTSKKGGARIVASNNKKGELKGKIDGEEGEMDEGEIDEVRVGKGKAGKGKAVRRRGKDAAAYEAFRARVRAYRAELKEARDKFVAGKHAFPDGLDSRESLVIVINSGKCSFPNILEVVGFKISESSFQRTEDVDDLYASLDYDAALISKLDGIFSKLDKKISNRSTAASDVIAMLSNKIGRLNRLVLNEYFSDKNLDKMESKGSPGTLITANALLDTFMGKKAESLKLIKEHIDAASRERKEEDIHLQLTNIAKYGDVKVHNAVGLMGLEYDKIVKFCSAFGN